MNIRSFAAAVALVALAYAVAVGANADAEPTPVALDCEAWEGGALTPAAVQNLCRRQAILRQF